MVAVESEPRGDPRFKVDGFHIGTAVAERSAAPTALGAERGQEALQCVSVPCPPSHAMVTLHTRAAKEPSWGVRCANTTLSKSALRQCSGKGGPCGGAATCGVSVDGSAQISQRPRRSGKASQDGACARCADVSVGDDTAYTKGYSGA